MPSSIITQNPYIIHPSGFPPAFADWGFRVKVTVQASQVSATLTDFPVYVDLSDLPAGFFTNVKSDGADIRITKTDKTTELPREVVFITTGSSIGELHFEADTISSSSDTDFYIYYGNSSASEPLATATNGSEAVWATYRAVYHLQDANPGTTVLDSTAQSFDMTDVGTLVAGDSVDSKIGKGVKLEITKGQGLFHDDDPFTGYPFSYSGWLEVDAVADGRGSLWVGNNSVGNIHFELLTNVTFNVVLVARNTALNFITSPLTYGGQTIFMVCVFRSATDREVYVDGASIMGGSGEPSVTYASGINKFAIGYEASSSPNFGESIIDERRFINKSLSNAEILSQFTNQNTPTTFYAVGSQETN